MTFSQQELYASANILKSDEGENPEYDRALVEMIACLTNEDVTVVARKLSGATGTSNELI